MKNVSQAAKTTSKKHRFAGFAIKTLLVGGLLYFLFQKGFISLKDTSNAFARWDKTGPAFAVMLISSFLGVVRWQWLLRAQGIHLPWFRTFQLTYIGNFFNVALPGAVSGDLVKALYIGKEIEGKRARAFGSILFDRVAGVSALAIVSAGALILGSSSLQGTVLWFAVKLFVLIAALGVLFFFAYLFLIREEHDPLLRFFIAAESRFKKLGSLLRIYEGLRHYHYHRAAVLKVLALSIVVHLAVGWASYTFAQALGEAQPSLVAIYVIVPLGLLITAVPVLPAGVGTGHAAFLYLFHLIGSQRGADIFTMLALANICVGMVGGLIYLRFTQKNPSLARASHARPHASAT